MIQWPELEKKQDIQCTYNVKLRSVREAIVAVLSIKYYDCMFVLAVVMRKAKHIFCALYRGRRRRKLLDDLKERRGYSNLKEEALDRAVWRARFGRGFGPVVRQTID